MPFIDGAETRKPWSHAGTPTSGTSGTLASVARKGDLLIDETNALLYQNTNTQASPTWTGLSATAALGSVTAGTPVNAVAASKKLGITGVVIDGEMVTVGEDVYEFCADAAQSLSDGTIAVDIEANATKAQGTLTVDTNPTAGNTMTIGTKEYTFVPVGTANADGEIDVEALVAGTQENIVVAINGTDEHNDPHPLVTAADFADDDCVITALVGGTAGNAIASTETFTAETNVFDAVVLGTTTAGANCTNANAKTALIAAVTASDTQGVGAADGGGNDVTFTADVKGVAGNEIELAETLANGAWAGAATSLSGGVDGTVGSQWEMKIDATWFYVCVAANTIADANWRRVALGSVY